MESVPENDPKYVSVICGIFDTSLAFWHETIARQMSRKQTSNRVFIVPKLIKVTYKASLNNPETILKANPGNFEELAIPAVL